MNKMLRPVEPIATVHLFSPLSEQLLAVLRQLHGADWMRPTACSDWSVKDVVTHLLGGSLGRLKKPGETSAPTVAVRNYAELVELINRNNSLWVQACQRINSELLIAFLDIADRALATHFQSLNLLEQAPISVAWAGDKASLNWFDIAREYTEKWLHQQHIREAVGQPLLMEREWLHPVLDAFMRGLPHAYRALPAEDGTTITIEISGEAGGEWTLCRAGNIWRLFMGRDESANSFVRMDQDLAWRLFTKGISRDVALLKVAIHGDKNIGLKLLDMVTIMT